MPKSDKTGANVIRLNEEFIPTAKQSRSSKRDSVPELVRVLKTGNREQKETALLKLIVAGAEHELTDCLTSEDPDTATLATAGLWECWLNEEGPEARAAIDQAIGCILRAGKAPGILCADEALARHYLDVGARFIAVGVDTSLLVRATAALAAQFKTAVSAPASSSGVY